MPAENAIEIEILKGPDAGKRFVFNAQSVRIGRDPACQLRLIDTKVGRTHLDVTGRRKGLFECTDLDSANGTFLDGRRIEREMVSAGTALRLGDTVLRIGRDQGGTRKPRVRTGAPAITSALFLKISGFAVAIIVVIVAGLARYGSLSVSPPLTPPQPLPLESAMQRLRQGDFEAAKTALWCAERDAVARIWFRPGYLRMIEHAVERACRHERGGRLQFALDEWLALARRLEMDPESPVHCPVFGVEWQAAVAWIRAEKLDAMRIQTGQQSMNF